MCKELWFKAYTDIEDKLFNVLTLEMVAGQLAFSKFSMYSFSGLIKESKGEHNNYLSPRKSKIVPFYS